MGIAGLSNFIENSHPQLGKRAYLDAIECDALVIDGNSLTYYLAQRQNWLFGAQYKTLTKRTMEFMGSLRTFKIFVVFDGSLPDYKLQERQSRNQGKIFNQISIVNFLNSNPVKLEHTGAAKLLPPFAVTVVMNAINALSEVQVIIAREEADHVIAQLAKKHNALVISQDSDFFLYNVPFYTQLSSFTTVADDKIMVQVYTRTSLAQAFKIKSEHVHLLGVLGGSDVFSRAEMDSFYKTHANIGFNCSTNKKKWLHLINFVKRFGNHDAINVVDQICSQLKTYWREKFRACFVEARKQYDLLDDDLADFIVLQKEASDYIGEDGFSREAIAKKIACGGLNYKILEVVDSLTFWCMPCLEDCSQETFWDYSSSIRKDIYSLVVNGQSIREYYQQEGGMTFRIVEGQSDVNITKWNGPWSEWDIALLAICHFVEQSLLRVSKIGNYELCGWLAAMVLTGEVGSDQQFQTIPTIAGLNQLIQLEGIFYCLSLLLPLNHQFAIDSFWKSLDGPTFHWSIQQAKRGSSPKQLLKKGDPKLLNQRLDVFYKSYQQIYAKFKESIDIIIDYGVDSSKMYSSE